MRVLITGGTGFLGKKLTGALLREGALALDGGEPRRIERITLFDAAEGEDVPQDPRLELVTGDITEPETVRWLARDADLVWHLAAVVSAGAEADFDLGMAVNVDGTRLLLEALRATGRRPRLVFASGFAVFGGALPEVVTDETAPTPQSSYGMEKAVGELLVADYGRKGFIDGRSLRLPTIVVRPGKPNKAASTFASSIIREPLAGQEAVCPVPRETALYILSPRRVIEALLKAMQVADEAWGVNRTVPLPGITVTVGEMLDTLAAIAGKEVAARVRMAPDPLIQRIVASWPVRVEARHARALGFEADASFEAIVKAHVEDELEGVVR
jgi:nucleoside-diphosphate-sugar epimerase